MLISLSTVEGSTELWEWDTDLMAAAIDLHDHTLRSQMSKWYGYEVQTEGDAFLMAFHEPADAVGWCITTQLALLNADWDRELFRHHKACIETLESLQPSSQAPSTHMGNLSTTGPAGQPSAGQQPAAASGVGVLAVRGAAVNGGEQAGIIIGPPLGGNSGMSSVKAVTPPRMSASGADEVAGPGGGPALGLGLSSALPAGSSGTVPTAGGGLGWPDDSKLLRPQANGGKPLPQQQQQDMTFGGVAAAAEFADWTRYTRLQVLFRGLRVRMGVATGVTDAITSHAITQRMEYSGEVYRRVQAVADLPERGAGLF
ncbi:hypothetical protein GPECTOR_50g597 [Gonium pectorale]|uniref:Uncharacterized protein n=1 Tax=Gonium pectorale TaxID=33097 RepID=A0A150G7Q6_GONPE|nr:hypothetical protein GPECTOR_50g597 [Gonium pectorale]|eukprot:KXZ45803.1 hypothetical protein GPECTOR_50g597 [Gonium pectorale]